METSESLLKKAVLLKPKERSLLIEGLLQSIDKPDKVIDSIWSEEAENRLKAHREGRTKAITYRDVFGDA